MLVKAKGGLPYSQNDQEYYSDPCDGVQKPFATFQNEPPGHFGWKEEIVLRFSWIPTGTMQLNPFRDCFGHALNSFSGASKVVMRSGRRLQLAGVVGESRPISGKLQTKQGSSEKIQYGDGNMGTVAEQQMLLKIA